MCGIVGFSGKTDKDKLKLMMDAIHHRGPDDGSSLEMESYSLGFRRLAIVDLSKNIYPLTNEEETLFVFLNGEIYNYEELKKDLTLKGHKFITGSDTEVIAHGYEEWGEDVLNYLRGMFVFTIYNKIDDSLFIARDRLGIKPLYYSEIDDRIVFSSEIKAIFSAFDVVRDPDEISVYRFLTSRIHDIDERTFFKNVKRLLPGHFMKIYKDGMFEIKKYWDPSFTTEFSSKKSDKEYSNEFKDIFTEAVKLHLIGDVPVGVTLSGGLDSSGITTLASRLYKENYGKNEMYSFSAVHPNETINEEEYIDNIVNLTGVKSIKVTPSVDLFWSELERWTYFQEEPVISAAPYAYYTVMKEARKHVTVLLSGQGGDELLAGYIPYFMTYAQSALDNGKLYEVIRESLMGLDLYSSFLFKRIEEKIYQFSKSSNSEIKPLEMIKLKFKEEPIFKKTRNLNERLFRDVTSLTTPSLLRYEDKNSMAHSLESRVPFFDHKVVEYIFNLPIDQKIKFGWNRYIYREAMKGIIPDKNRLRRSKVGFTNPEWEWIERKQANFIEIFSSDSFRSRSFWDANLILNNFKLTLEGKMKGDILFFWRVFSVEMWMRGYVDNFKVIQT